MTKQIGIENTAQSSVDFGRRDLLKLTGAGVAALGAASLFSISFAKAQDMSNGQQLLHQR
ncbi:twin-arginine translocation signal domain-containing protein [Mesorhizobium sp.]|uniref:twin-arginine translocation signal domain-containing protein n=1 Tax=Mesorhizobium sp. TaxID=1871066 RepID=UPI00257B23D3|nr:twin-arginine translocation signal domain-containing protein [Mesorhizobium sp.]